MNNIENTDCKKKIFELLKVTNIILQNKNNKKKSNVIIPPNLSGTAFIKPKKVKKNHSGMTLSLVFITFTISKLSSWNTKNQ